MTENGLTHKNSDSPLVGEIVRASSFKLGLRSRPMKKIPQEILAKVLAHGGVLPGPRPLVPYLKAA